MRNPISLAAAAAASSLILSGCVIVDGEFVTEDDIEFNRSDRYETVYAASVAADEISITVYTKGCTTGAFFEPDIRHRGGDEFTVGFERVRQDYCGMDEPFGQKIIYTFEELGLPAGADVSIRNPVGRS